VVRAGPTFELLHTNLLADDDMVMATPAIADGRVFLRTDRRLYCLHQPPTPAADAVRSAARPEIRPR